MNKTINKRDTVYMLNEINRQIDDIMKESFAIQRVIDDFIEDCGPGQKLRGAGFESAANYFSCTYKEILSNLNSFCAVLGRQNKALVDAIDSNITLANHDTMYQEQLRRELAALQEELVRATVLMITDDNGPAGGSVWADSDNRKSFFLSNTKNEIQAIQDQIERMDTLDEQTKELYSELLIRISEISDAVNKINPDKCFDPEKDKLEFVVPENLDLTSVTATHIDDIVKDEELNTEALDPVNMATGNYMYRKNFLVTNGITPLTLEITYNSVDSFKRRFASAGWTHNYKTELTIYKSKIVLTVDSGRRETYLKEGDEYRNKDGHSSRRLTVLTSGEYAYQYSNGKHERFYFDESGRCLKKVTSEGQTISFEYDELLLKKLSTDFGTGYIFDYELADDGTPYVTQISDFAGRSIKLNYSDISDEFSRTGKTRVLAEILDEMGQSYSFKYNDFCKMYTVTNARGTVNLINEYDGNGRVMRQIFPDGGEILIDYRDLRQNVIATHQNGSQTNYEHDKKFRSTITKNEHGYEEFTYTDSNNRSSFRDKNGNITTYKYNAFGDVVLEKTPAGDVFETVYSAEGKPLKATLNDTLLFENAYDENGNVKSSTDAIGRTTEFQYNKYNLPVKITNPDGTAVTLKYDERGNLAESIDEIGNVNKYEYDNLNRVISSTDGNGHSYNFSYNARNEITESIDPLGHKRVFEYNESGKPIRVIDYDGYEELLKYNELNKISEYVDKDGAKTEYSYNKMWQVEKVVDPVGAKTLYTYDSAGNLTKITDATFASISYSYDSCGNMIKVRDQEGNVTHYEYDVMNRPIKVTMHDGSIEHYEYDAFGNETKYTDALGGEWISEYDPAGQKIKDINPDGIVTNYEYNLCGKLIGARTLNQSVKYSYDDAGRLTDVTEATGAKSQYSYDANGYLTRALKGGVEKTYEYDCLSRITKKFTAGALTASYEYDAVGNIISVTDGLGNKTRYVRSKAGHIIAVIDPLGNVTRYRYDKAHRLMNIVQGEGDEANSIDLALLDDIEEVMKINNQANSLRIVSYARDILGREISVTDALGNTELYEYDKRGFIKSKTDMDGNRTEIGRTHHGDISRLSYANGDVLEYKYDPLRRLKEIKDALGITTVERDSLGRETSITDHKGRTVSYTYDAMGNRTSIRYANGKDVRYEYNESGLLIGIDCEDKKALFSYDEYGRVATKKIGSAETRYSYNEVGKLASLVNMDSDNILDSYEYGYDPVGNLTSSRQMRAGLPVATGLFEYCYDPAGRLNTVAKDGSLIRDYSYDAFGNRTSLSENGIKTVYEYNKANQLLSADSADGEITFAYDKRGNIVQKKTSQGVSISYTYGVANRLVQATKNVNGTSQTANYIYNGLGMRVGRTTEAGSVDYILDQTKMYSNMLEKADKETSEEYVWFNNELVMAGGEPTLTGRLSSVERAQGSTCEVFAYDEFGLPLSAGAAMGFTGYIHDEITDTYFAQAREYMPEIGRFAGRDILKGRVENPRSLNEYAYCHNNPVGFVDFNGMEASSPNANETHSDDPTTNDYIDAGVESGGTNAAFKFIDDYANNRINNWEATSTKAIYKKYRDDIKKYSKRSSKIFNKGAQKAKDKLKIAEDAQTAELSKTAKMGKAGRAVAKYGPSVAFAVADVGYDYYEDYNKGLSNSKRNTNLGVNAAYAFGGIAVTTAAAPTLIAAGPAGWIAAGMIGIGWGLFTLATSDTVKNWINSLD